KSTDGAKSFAPQTVVPSLLADCECPAGPLAVLPGAQASNGLDHVGFAYTDGNGALFFARSTDAGATWTSDTRITSSGESPDSFPVVRPFGASGLIAVWEDQSTGSGKKQATRTSVMAATSEDWGATWTKAVTLVDGADSTSIYPWVAASGSRVVVSLYNTAAGDKTAESVPSDAPWYESYLTGTADLTSGTVTWTSTLTRADPEPVKTGPICTGGAECNGDRELGDFQSI